MEQTTRICSPAAHRVTDRFHVQKLAYEAVQEMRVKAHWEALDEKSIQMAYAQGIRKIYHDPVFKTGIQGNSCWQEASISSIRKSPYGLNNSMRVPKSSSENIPIIKEAYYLLMRLG